MLQLLRERAKHLRAVFEEFSNIVCVYIFGSYAKGLSTSRSDLDFAILTEDGTFQEKALLAYRIEKTLGFTAPVELIVLNQQKLMFQHTVIRDGKIVYEKDPQFRVSFELEVMKRFCELEPHLRFMEKYRIKGLLRRLGYETT